MILCDIAYDDIPILCNYVIDELHKMGVTATSMITDSLYNAIKDGYGWKIEVDNTIIAFCVFEYVDKKTVHILSYYVADGYRLGKAYYLLAKKAYEVMSKYRTVTYSQLYGNQKLPALFCIDGVINKSLWESKLKRLDSRWEVVQKP